MTKEQAIERLKKMIQINNGVIKEVRKNGDIFAIQLTADLDTDSIAIEKVLSMLEEKDKVIDLMAEAMRYYNGMQQKQEFCIDICEEKECNIEKCKDCIKQYYENEAKELINK